MFLALHFEPSRFFLNLGKVRQKRKANNIYFAIKKNRL